MALGRVVHQHEVPGCVQIGAYARPRARRAATGPKVCKVARHGVDDDPHHRGTRLVILTPVVFPAGYAFPLGWRRVARVADPGDAILDDLSGFPDR